MKEIDFDPFTPMWEGYDYSADKEPFWDMITCGEVTDIAEHRCMIDMSLQPQREADNPNAAQILEVFREMTDKNGSVYLVGKDGFHKKLAKGHIIYTVPPLNDIVRIPHDVNQFWFISPVIKVDKTIKND